MPKDQLTPSNSLSVQEFLKKSDQIVPSAEAAGRLLFAMDATASREHSWDMACQIQSDMFLSTEKIGSLEISLCYYRGYNEFHAFSWTKNASQLRDQMLQVRCIPGHTQIKRTLDYAAASCVKQKIRAVVFVGDCFEESIDNVGHAAGKLGMMGVPVFVFHEGNDPAAKNAFQHIAKLSNGAYCAFDQNSVAQLKELLCAVAAFTVGGINALQKQSQKSAIAKSMLKQLPASK
ncbi:MAG: VWA domain-containing protein [Pseudomonadota bacterium]